jgi:uncharacterized protein YdhG (YjbR/CyaY superfamily)
MMNKRMRGVWIMILSVLLAAPLSAAGEQGGGKTRSVGTADQGAVQKTAKHPDLTPSTATVSAVMAKEQPEDRVAASKETENPYTVKRPKLIAVQDLAQQKEAAQSPVSPDIERKSMPVILSPTSENKLQLQAPSRQKMVPLQKKKDISSPKQPVSKSKDLPQDKKSRAETDKAELNKQDDERMLQKERRAAAKAEKILKAAMRYYRTCDLPAAEESIDRCLAVAPGNQAAVTLKSKITNIREKTEEMRIDLAEQCYYRAEGYKREGNILDAMLLAQKAFQLNPRLEKARVLSRTLSESHEEIVKSLQGGDKERFREAVAAFLEEDFSNAAAIVRRLQRYYPQLTDMLAVAEIHSGDKANSQRSRTYYASALDNIYKERYIKAQEDLYLALEMDKNNLDVKQKLLLVNQELGTQRTSAVGQ